MSHQPHHLTPCKKCQPAFEGLQAEIVRLKHLAYTDHLTGLSNRRAFDERLQYEIVRAKRHKYTLSLALLDLDHFKRVNDTHGHPVGDAVLVGLATILKRMYRETDFIARIGGEEFAIILPVAHVEASKCNSHTYCERLRKEIAQDLNRAMSGEVKEGISIHLTASFGLAEMVQTDKASDLLKRADTALYSAKRDGRNCVFVL